MIRTLFKLRKKKWFFTDNVTVSCIQDVSKIIDESFTIFPYYNHSNERILHEHRFIIFKSLKLKIISQNFCISNKLSNKLYNNFYSTIMKCYSSWISNNDKRYAILIDCS